MCLAVGSTFTVSNKRLPNARLIGHAVIASLVPPHWPRGRGDVSASRPSSGPQLMQGRSTRARRSNVGTPPEPLFGPQSPRRLANGAAAGGAAAQGRVLSGRGRCASRTPPPTSSSRPEQSANRCGGALHRARFWAWCSPQRCRRRSGDCAGAVGVSHPRAPHLDRRAPTPGSPSIPRPRTHVDIFPATPLPPPYCSPPLLLCARLPFVFFFFPPFAVSPTRPSVGVCLKRGARGHCLPLLPSPPRRRVPFPIASVAARPGSHRHGAFAARTGTAAATTPVFPSRFLPLLGRSRRPVEPPRPPRPAPPCPRLCLVIMEHPAVVGLGSAALPLRGVAEVPPRRAGCSASAGLGGGPPPPGVAKAGGVAGAGVRRVSPAAPPRSPRPSARGRAGDRQRRQLACPTPRRAMPASTLVGGMYVYLFPNVLFFFGGPRPRMQCRSRATKGVVGAVYFLSYVGPGELVG